LKLGLSFDPRPQGTLGYKIYDKKIAKNLKIVIFSMFGGARVHFFCYSDFGTKFNFGIFLSYLTSNIYINLTLPPEQNNIYYL
jgi:hypothetical protein